LIREVGGNAEGDHDAGLRPEEKVVGVEVFRRLPLSTLDLGQPKARLDRHDHGSGDLVLQIEDVREIPIEAISPNVPSRRGLDQLARDPGSPRPGGTLR
jgi:hypothetical protein